MDTPEYRLDNQQRLYSALLLLYPRRFQVRFGPEMAQVFQDTRLDGQGRRSLIAFWLQTLNDLVFSIALEWRREVNRDDCEVDVTGLADSFMITVVVGTNLLVWGWTGARFALDLPVWSVEAMVLMSIVTVLLAILFGVVSVMFVARKGRTESPRIKV